MDELNIKVYGAPGCPACSQAKMFLESKSIPFTYISVGVDITPQEFVAATGAQSVPVIFINDEKHIGWNPTLFE